MIKLTKAIGIAALLTAATLACAQSEYPNKAIKIVIPFAPGGVSDAVVRPLAQAMAGILGQPVVIDNKPGASGNIALDLVARSPSDGYTLLLGNISTNAMNQTSYAHTLKSVPAKDLTAVTVIGITPSVLVASMNFAPRSASEFIAYAKANPGKVNYWLPGIASGPHFDMVQLEKANGIKMTAVPFSGGAGPGMAALIGGQVDIGLVNLGGALPQIRAGKLKALAISTPSRLSDLADTPTATEAGLGTLTSSWHALFVPAATPKAIVQKLHAAALEAMALPTVKDAIAKTTTIATPSKSPEVAQNFIVAETSRWAKIITESGVKADAN
jgi:tripartite-type tricarboxylate transporter receptor subunit TctC